MRALYFVHYCFIAEGLPDGSGYPGEALCLAGAGVAAYSG